MNFLSHFEIDDKNNVKFNQFEEQLHERAVMVVSDNGLMNAFQKRANDDFWKTINFVQTCVKAQIGCGTPIIVNFFAPINTKRVADTIDYNFRQFGEDEEIIKKGLEERYCLKQTYKMCYYIQ